jgi:adenylate cyclase
MVRLEKIAGRLSRTIVASEGFAGICAGGWSELGEFPIAGFSKAERVFGLLDEATVQTAGTTAMAFSSESLPRT